MCSVESRVIVSVNSVSEIRSCDTYISQIIFMQGHGLRGANLVNPGEQRSFSERRGPIGSRGWEPASKSERT